MLNFIDERSCALRNEHEHQFVNMCDTVHVDKKWFILPQINAASCWPLEKSLQTTIVNTKATLKR